jgi:nucleoid-associated protein YgaU
MADNVNRIADDSKGTQSRKGFSMQKVGKEVKIGLAVIGVLLVAFGYVLVKRLSRPADEIASNDSPAAAADEKNVATATAKNKPTVVTATDSQHPGDSAADGSRSRWTNGARSAETSDAGNDEPRDLKNPFAVDSRELSSADSRGSIFTRNQTAADAPQPLPESSRRQGPRDDGDGDGRAATIQASDNAPAATASDQSPPLRSNLIFARAANDRGNDDKGGDKTAADNGVTDRAISRNPFEYRGDASSAPSNPFNRGSADSAPSPDPFNRRPADSAPSVNAFDRQANDAPSRPNPFDRRPADAAPSPDALPRKSTDATIDARAADRGFVERQSPDGNSLTPVDRPPLKSVGADAANSSNPLRGNASADAQTTGGSSDSTDRFTRPNRPVFTDSSGSSSVAPVRDAGSAAPARIFDSGTAASQPLVGDEPPKAGQYIVQPNDSYYTISQKVYGDGGFFKAIYEHNRRQHPKPERLQVGDVLLVPDAATLQKLYPDLCPKPGRVAASQRVTPASARLRPGTKVYVVEEGDTLFKIAKEHLGNPSRWGEVYQLNRELLGKDYDYLKPGTELLLPSGEPRSDPIARQPGATVN